MREILFRAKRIDLGEWVEGYYTELPAGSVKEALGETEDTIGCIIRICSKQHNFYSNGYPLEVIEREAIAVDWKTVCQYTGLKDKNGKRIFEGDIVDFHYFFENHDPETLGRFEDEKTIVAKIGINCFGTFFENRKESGFIIDYVEPDEASEELEVIGNIFDSPELLQFDEG